MVYLRAKTTQPLTTELFIMGFIHHFLILSPSLSWGLRAEPGQFVSGNYRYQDIGNGIFIFVDMVHIISKLLKLRFSYIVGGKSLDLWASFGTQK
jgi:hypothetical protein